jgi:DNA-directed RNA polymerase beta' subunit
LRERTLAPEPGGLFCDQIFGEGPLQRGPFADDEPVTEARATRFGRIELPVPIVHPLALAHAPDEVAARAGIPRDELDELVAYTDPSRWARLGQLLAGTADGAALLLRVLPVLPPYLRPLKRIDDNRWVTADLNDLYRRVINRVHRLRRLLELAAPDDIVAQEHRFLGEAVHMLFANEERPAPATDVAGRPYVSLRTLAIGNRLFEALSELDRRGEPGLPDGRPLPRTLHHPIAALHAMGLELA